MKKIWILVLVMFCLTACNRQKSVTEATQPKATTTVPEISVLQPETTVPETTAPPPETTVAETFPTLPDEVTLEDLFMIIWDETLTWKSAGKEMVFTCPVPELLPFSEDALRVSEEIQKTLWEFIDREKYNMNYKQSKSYVSVGYQTYLNGDILSVMTWAEDNHDKTVYNAWNLDLETGKQLTGPEMAALIGLAPEQYDAMVEQKVEEAFYERCGDGVNFPDPAFYQQQYEHCLSQENLEKVQLYFGEDGEAILIAPIIPVAGASNYPTLIPLGLS